MTAQRLVIALTGLNLALVASTFFSRTRPAVAASGVAPVLRGSALEIVDDRGRVRASIAVLPADPAFKMLVLGGGSDPMYAQILARGDSTFLKLSNKNGKVHLVEP